MKFNIYFLVLSLITLYTDNLFSSLPYPRLGEMGENEQILSRKLTISVPGSEFSKKLWGFQIENKNDIIISKIDSVHFNCIAPYIPLLCNMQTELSNFLAYNAHDGCLALNKREIQIRLNMKFKDHFIQKPQNQQEIENLLIAINIAVGFKYANYFTIQSKLDAEKEKAENATMKQKIDRCNSRHNDNDIYFKYGFGTLLIIIFGHEIRKAMR
jgi:hypothetical protein